MYNSRCVCEFVFLIQFKNYCTCSLQLLNIVRDNQVVIVVGETGSGKTTQLTQVRKNVNRSTRKQRRCEVLNELTSENILIFNVSCKVGNVPLFGLYVLKKK